MNEIHNQYLQVTNSPDSTADAINIEASELLTLVQDIKNKYSQTERAEKLEIAANKINEYKNTVEADIKTKVEAEAAAAVAKAKAEAEAAAKAEAEAAAAKAEAEAAAAAAVKEFKDSLNGIKAKLTSCKKNLDAKRT